MKNITMVKRFVTLSLVLMVCFLVVACAPEMDSSAGSGSTEASTGGAEWSMDIDCLTCHVDQGATTASESSGAGIHVKHANATCISCHADEPTLTQVHKGATPDRVMPTQLKSSMVSCQSSGCHDLSPEEMTALTADITVLTDIEGTLVNPHEVMGLTPGHSEILCSTCHVMHGSTTDVLAAEACVSCHHAGVYKCNTCH